MSIALLAAKRIGELVLVLLLVSLGTFGLTSLLPGDPTLAILGPDKPPEQYAALRAELGLDDPFLVRYFDWLGAALTGDFGKAFAPPNPDVAGQIMRALPVSAEIAVLALLFALVGAVPLAMWSAYRAGGAVDRLLSGATFAVLSVPSFLAGLLLILVFVDQLGALPRGQWVRLSESVPGNLEHAILPALTVSLLEMAMFTRVLRGDMVSTLQEDFILAARAKGMPVWRIMLADVLRPSSFSLVTMAGMSIGRLIGSTVIVEYLFSLPGLGTLVTTSAGLGDVPVVQATVLVVALIYVLGNTLIDLSYGVIDPRIRSAHA